MALADRRNKDQAMAARMKMLGTIRTTARCPLCNGIVHPERMYQHISFHPTQRLQLPANQGKGKNN